MREKKRIQPILPREKKFPTTLHSRTQEKQIYNQLTPVIHCKTQDSHAHKFKTPNWILELLIAARFLPKWWSPPKKEGISLSHEFGQRLVRMGSKTKVIPLKMRIQFGNNSSDSLLNSRTNHSVEFPPPNGRKKQPKSGFLKGSGPPSGFSPVTPEQKEFPITTISISPFMRDHVIGIPSIANSIVFSVGETISINLL